jgi:predicted DNA-binding WGR domain protein
MKTAAKPDWKTRLEFVGDNPANESGRSAKFWQAEVYGSTFVRRWGRIGATGQTKSETFATHSEATSAALKMCEEKKRGGYTLEVDIITLIGKLGV